MNVFVKSSHFDLLLSKQSVFSDGGGDDEDIEGDLEDDCETVLVDQCEDVPKEVCRNSTRKVCNNVNEEMCEPDQILEPLKK